MKKLTFIVISIILCSVIYTKATNYVYPVWKINCGFLAPHPADPDQSSGPIQGFVPDTFAVKGNALWYWGEDDNLMSTEGVENAAPRRVYQYCRFAWSGDTEYKITGLKPGKNYMVRLHWAEAAGATVGSRLMDVVIQGQLQEADFDIYKEAGNKCNLAVVRDYEDIPADAEGNIDILFVQKKDLPVIHAIEIYSDEPAALKTPTDGNKISILKLSDSQIKIESFAANIEKVYIFNVKGQTIYSNSAVNNKQLFIDSSNFTRGVYLVKTIVNGIPVSNKIVF